MYMYVLVTQSRPTLCDPMDYSSPGSSVTGIFQTRILECVANPLFRGSSLTQDSNWGLLHCRQILYCLNHQGSPINVYVCMYTNINIIYDIDGN